MLDDIIKHDEAVVFGVWEWRRLVIGAIVFYFVLCLGIGYFGEQWWHQRAELETWRVAYCQESARLFAAEYPQTQHYLTVDLADCASSS